MTINPRGAFKANPCLAAKHEAQIAREMHKAFGREGRAPTNTKITGGSEEQLEQREQIRVRIIEVVKKFGPMSSRDVHAELPDLSWHQIRHYLIEMRRGGRVKCWKDKTRIANWYVEGQRDDKET